MIFSSVSLKILMEVLVTERISCASRWIFMFVNRQIPLTTRLMSQVQNCGIRRKRWGHRFGLFISISDHHCQNSLFFLAPGIPGGYLAAVVAATVPHFFPTCSCQLGHRWKRLKKLLTTHNVASQVTGVSKAVPLSSLFPIFIIFVHSFAPLPSR